MKRLLHVLGPVLAFSIGRAGDLQWSASPFRINTNDAFGSVTVDIPFVNKASQSVSVISVQGSCDCLHIEPPVGPIAPGRRGVLNLTINTSRKTGELRHSLLVRYIEDSANLLEDSLEVVTNIAPVVEIRPALLLWRKNEDPSDKMVEVKPTLAATIEAVMDKTDAFSVREIKPGKDGSFIVVVRRLGGRQASSASLQIAVKGDGFEKHYTVPMTVLIR